MSAQDEVREVAEWLAEKPDEDREEYLASLFKSLPSEHKARAWHDSDGYFADKAGGEKCLSFGHVLHSDLKEWNGEDGYSPAADHGPSWDGEELCLSTKYGVACSYCEGECSMNYGQIPSLWEMVASKGEVSE